MTAELAHIDALVRGLVKAAAARERSTPFGAATVSAGSLDSLLAVPLGSPALWSRGASEVPPQSRAEAARLASEAGRSRELQSLFGLSDFERDLLLVAFAPSLDARYERLYAFLHDDPAATGATVELALVLLCRDAAARLEALAAIHRGLPVFRHGLLHTVGDALEERPELRSARLAVDPRIAAWLLGADDPDERLKPFAELDGSTARIDDLCLAGNIAPQLRNAALAFGSKAVYHFRGPAGFGKRTAASAICREAGLRLLAVDCESLAALPRAELSDALAALHREALLLPASVYFDDIEKLAGEGQHAAMNAVLRFAAALPGTCFFGGESVWEPPDALFDHPVRRVDFTRVAAADRARLWTAGLNGAASAASGLAGRFRLSPAQIRNAVATARNLAAGRADDLRPADLFEACRMQSASRLRSLARKVRTGHTWDDLVLPPDRVRILREICNAVRHRARVYEEWGFDRKLSLGKGLAVLFAGAPGTGKTMAAGIMGATLGLDLYKVDLSVVVSKYIGETEKNLARIFTEAENTNAILFFDEADALFGRRSEVRDSHDRYANIEVGYLLQRMEEYEGMVILATNFRKNMDEAFVRRLQQTVEFPLPSAEERERIWRGVWPGGAPLGPDCDFELLARRYEITGGSIRNIALAAAFLAAEEDAPIAMRHLMHGLRREYQKMGKVVADAFEPAVAGRSR